MRASLYSVNLHVMGKSNVSLLDVKTVVEDVHKVIPASVTWSDDLSLGVLFLVVALVLGGLLTWYLRTDFGMAMRAVGDNPAMITAQGVDRHRMIELGLAIANGLVAFSGALMAQQQGFADVGMGVGTLVAGMAAVIMGETLLFNRRGLGVTIIMVAAGAILFRGLVALALRAGLNPIRSQAGDGRVRARRTGTAQAALPATSLSGGCTMIEIERLEKTFTQPGGERVQALRTIDVLIPSGQFVTVIGSNGSGKSTLLNAIAGSFLPDAGTIRIGGTDVTRRPEFRRAALIGRVFQDPFKGTCPSMSVAENLRMAEICGERRGLRLGLNGSALERYHTLLSGLGMRLEGRLKATMGTLSGGQRQAVTLLMATLKRPQLLLLDEHTAALDPRAADQVINLTNQVVREHALTTLMVTHSMEQALEQGDRTIMMHSGEVLADLSGSEREGLDPGDLLRRFAELRYTIEFAVAARPT